eukprot:TRINITY_DN1087_c0_g2_i4.p1 TRINITY_DN1087_c0_g2~~TRINITY_DN1087_c0_g2_i4.p1  ORF type:complete len:967 (+),score=388.13 TRINITY_DN1087_c0_g2_i4:147-3047(+)
MGALNCDLLTNHHPILCFFTSFGSNMLPPAPHKNFFELLWDALQDVTLIILAVAGVISTVLGLAVPHEGGTGNEWLEGVAILLAVALVSLVTAGNDYSKEKQFRSLNSEKNNKPVNVIRSGKISQISIYTVQVGDIVVLQQGDQVPADGYVTEHNNLKTDEASMTGESDEQKKDEEKPFMLSGCLVSGGSGRMIVTGTGINSLWGETFANLQTEPENTPLQDKLDIMAANIGKVGVFFATITFIALLIRFLAMDLTPETPASEFTKLVDFFIIAVTIVVVAIPEGLPLAVTISLAYSMRKMMEDKNLVRHLAACETMGGATNICSDKTGTLTLNEMTVDEIYYCGEHFKKVPKAEQVPQRLMELYMEGASVNSTAFFQMDEKKKMEVPVGNKSEGALIKLTRTWDEPEKYMEIRNNADMVQQYQFTSASKKMSTIIQPKEDSKNVRLHTKGASEIVLESCTDYIDANGEEVHMTEEDKQQITDAINNMANNALRTLILAYSDIKWSKLKKEGYEEAPVYNMTFICLVGIMDPVRPEVPEAVAKCHRAGVFVRMVTGDNLLTAKAIARKCRILENEDDICIEGPDFRKLSDIEIDGKLDRLKVMARSAPSDKHKLVMRLRNLGEVVGVTGDGTNDAPALKAADIGLAMGIAGTEVAKEASDVIIMDDNFNSIVKAITWGRCVYDNIRKFIQFQLTVNVVALVVAFIGALSFGESPLTALQLLWVNLIMDTMGALALGTEPPDEENLLSRKPYGRFESLISPIMARNIAGQALYQCILLFVLLYGGCGIFNLTGAECNAKNSIHYTIIFNAFVWCQIVNEVNSRKVNDEFHVTTGLLNNALFVTILAFTIGFQFFLVEVAQTFMNCHPLSFEQHLACILFGLVSFPLGYLIRMLPPLKIGKDYSEHGTQTDLSYGSPIYKGENADEDQAESLPAQIVVELDDNESESDDEGLNEIGVVTSTKGKKKST